MRPRRRRRRSSSHCGYRVGNEPHPPRLAVSMFISPQRLAELQHDRQYRQQDADLAGGERGDHQPSTTEAVLRDRRRPGHCWGTAPVSASRSSSTSSGPTAGKHDLGLTRAASGLYLDAAHTEEALQRPVHSVDRLHAVKAGRRSPSSTAGPCAGGSCPRRSTSVSWSSGRSPRSRRPLRRSPCRRWRAASAARRCRRTRPRRTPRSAGALARGSELTASTASRRRASARGDDRRLVVRGRRLPAHCWWLVRAHRPSCASAAIRSRTWSASATVSAGISLHPPRCGTPPSPARAPVAGDPAWCRRAARAASAPACG